jgi:excisionase family DNA binding protein
MDVKLLTADQVADKLGVCRKTVFTLTAPRGTLPAISFGRSVRYRPADVEAWVASRVVACQA